MSEPLPGHEIRYEAFAGYPRGGWVTGGLGLVVVVAGGLVTGGRVTGVVGGVVSGGTMTGGMVTSGAVVEVEVDVVVDVDVVVEVVVEVVGLGREVVVIATGSVGSWFALKAAPAEADARAMTTTGIRTKGRSATKRNVSPRVRIRGEEGDIVSLVGG